MLCATGLRRSADDSTACMVSPSSNFLGADCADDADSFCFSESKLLFAKAHRKPLLIIFINSEIKQLIKISQRNISYNI